MRDIDYSKVTKRTFVRLASGGIGKYAYTRRKVRWLPWGAARLKNS